ncbi:hypothetical protein EDB86DRAFT_2834214 [Lactarius hatsudake]|nr:hypothetical protein EDB86DRAFT_2834214 [Lactarius hatsudake]
MAADMSGELSGLVGYLACYKKAMKVVEEGLDEETWVEYRAEAKKWAEQEAPPQQQQYWVELPSKPSTKASYMTQWLRSSQDGLPSLLGTTLLIVVKMLLNWETIDCWGLIYKKMVIGQFMSEMYRIAAGGGKRRVPWAKLREAQGNWIAAEYLPEGVTLMQYHHICLDNVNSLLKHWIQRQATSKIPFCFKKVDKADWHHDGGAGGSKQHKQYLSGAMLGPFKAMGSIKEEQDWAHLRPLAVCILCNTGPIQCKR